MAFYNENFGSRILELLNYPLLERCPELGILFERCSLRELQEIFPILINSIFGINSGGIGWGLRTITKENSPHIFDLLVNFFAPTGPIFRLCYRLLNDAFKFEISIDLLPQKINETLLSGNYPDFYADLLQIDPFRRAITSLSLNAFDYFILNFVIHGTLPLHRIYPAALQVHNEKSKTVYFFLSADYLSFFLPMNPDSLVLPTNICGTVKAPQPVPVQPLQPTRLPKYLKLSPISHFTTAVTSSPNQSTTESPRAHAWRSESILYFFVDTWLRFNVDEMRDLPSSEFVRVVRILIKQLHAFASSADIDNTSMAVLRKLSLPMMKGKIYPFLKALIARWPLDASLSVVLELWLSYIQPWRYHYSNIEQPVIRYESFISENLIIYSQIFIEILQRFERLDFTSYRNVFMLFRITKIFSNAELPQILKACEQRLFNPLPTSSSTPHYNHQQQNTKRLLLYKKSTSSYNEVSSTNFYESFRPDGNSINISANSSGHGGSIFHDENYVPMFGPLIVNEVREFIKIISIAKIHVSQDIETASLELGNQKRNMNFIQRIIKSFSDEPSPLDDKLKELVRIPDILDIVIQSFSYIFEINLSEIIVDYIEERNITYTENCDSSDTEHDIRKLSPVQMKIRASKLQPAIDPALIPIQDYEWTILVRFLHQLSCKLNLMFYNQINNYWHRRDIWGKIARQILYPPMVTEWFDKSKGFSELRREHVPPRICLRVLGSRQTLILIIISLIIGQLFWGAPSYGLFLLCFIIIIYVLIRAVLS